MVNDKHAGPPADARGSDAHVRRHGLPVKCPPNIERDVSLCHEARYLRTLARVQRLRPERERRYRGRDWGTHEI